jgi:HD superfamily phosphodiesterase
VADAFMAEQGYPDDFKALVLECIAFHHGAGSEHSIEALLLRDADALDFLGAVGVLRDFAKNPKDLRGAYQATQKRRATLADIFHFETAKQLAAERIQRMDALLADFEQDTFGYF